MRVYKFVKNDPFHDNGHSTTFIIARDYDNALELFSDLCKRLKREDLIENVSIRIFGEIKVGVLDSDIEELKSVE